MRDEPIYYINQFSVFRRPKIWSRRGYWTFQILSTVLTVPILVLALALDRVPVLSYLALILTIALIGGAYNFRKGRQRAERY